MAVALKSGYKVGDRFKVIEECTFSKGSIIELYEDDGSYSPLFKLITGYCGWRSLPGYSKGAYCNLEKMIQSYPEYKIGDKVVLKQGGGRVTAEHSAVGQLCNSWIPSCMDQNVGKIATIRSVGSGGYSLEEYAYNWMPQWLEPYKPSAVEEIVTTEQQLQDVTKELNMVKAELAATKAQLFAANQKVVRVARLLDIYI